MAEDFDGWYAATRPLLAPALSAWCGDVDLASDALDEAFVRAVERWDRVGALASPSGWVWRTATNVVRRRTKRRGVEEGLWRRRAGPEESPTVDPNGADVDLQRALLLLTDRQRTAVSLFYLADLPVREVAEVMGVATGTVDATLHQARHLLSRHLGERSDSPDLTMEENDGARP